jgi:hypothetical protein
VNILNNKKLNVLLLIIIIILLSINLTMATPSIKCNRNKSTYLIDETNDLVLYCPMYGKDTFLINKNGEIINSWTSNYSPDYSVYSYGNGKIIRTTNVKEGVEVFDWDGNITWEYEYISNKNRLHHDIEPLPNGNILLIGNEYFTREEAIAQGRRVETLGIYSDFVIEVQPTNKTTGDIIWEWYVWDHLIQDYDPSKANYGAVADHPELIDINYYVGSSADWTHINSIDYNEEFDQILLSSLNYNEVWVIDHSTTTEEAADNTGGNSGKGGDILYRWGNPQTYHAGNETHKKLFGQHDAQWIKPEYPGEGHILVFNNGQNRTDGRYSSIDEFIPPVDSLGNYFLAPGENYGPEGLFWQYIADPPNSFCSSYISGVQRLLNGNTIICNGTGGKFFEVTPEGETVWEYENIYPSPPEIRVFKICLFSKSELYPPDLICNGSLTWKNIKRGDIVTGSFNIRNIGDPESNLLWKIKSFPNWGNWTFTPENGNISAGSKLSVNVQVIAPNKTNTEFEGEIKIINLENPDDFEIINVILSTPRNKASYNLLFLKFLEQSPLLNRFLTLLKN